MSGMAWDKFFWSDYASDPALKICSFAAQGLWMRMLCIAAEHEPRGFVAVNGNVLDNTGIARMTGGSIEEVETLIAELERNGVFNRDRRGWIYSRRMINDAKRRRVGQVTGKLGRNPKLRKQKENSETVKGDAKGKAKGSDNPQSPEARVQSKKNPTDSKKTGFPEGIVFEAFGDGTEAKRIADAWPVERRQAEFEAFKDYHVANGSKFVDWQAAWGTWVRNTERFKRDDRGQRQASGGGYLEHYVAKEMAEAKP